jgi:hypothetical protein
LWLTRRRSGTTIVYACANRAPASLSDTNSISTRLATVSLVGLIEMTPHCIRHGRAQRLPARARVAVQRSDQRRRQSDREHGGALGHRHALRVPKRRVHVPTRLPLGQSMLGLQCAHGGRARVIHQQLDRTVHPNRVLVGVGSATGHQPLEYHASRQVPPRRPRNRALKLEVRYCVGAVASPLLSNIYLSVFDEKMAKAGFALTRYCDDWVIICRSQAEAKRALASAREVLEGELRLRIHPEKTRIVHITRGFEFLGYKIGRGRGLRHKAGGPSLYAVPTDRSIERFKDKVRTATNRRNPKDLEGVLGELNPIIRGWGNYYRRAHVRRLFNRLNHWIVMRVWNHRHKHWRNAGWRDLPDRRLYGELGLVNLLQLLPSMENYYRQKGLVR